MAIGAGAAGAWAAVNATTQTVTLPAHAAGNLLLVVAAAKAAAITSVDPTIATAGWQRLATFADGTTNSGVGVGSVRQAWFWKIATSSSETNPVVSWGTTSTPGLAVAHCYTKGAGEVWITPVVVQAATTNATSISVTMGSNPGITTGDWGVIAHTTRDDSALTVPTWTATSATLGTVAVFPVTPIASGTSDDMAATSAYRSVTSGTASAAPVVTGTQAAAETGVTGFVRLRVATAAPQSVTPTTAAVIVTRNAPTVTVLAPQLVTPPIATLTTSRFAPTARTPILVTPAPATLATSRFAPAVRIATTATPTTKAVVTVKFAPTVSATNHQRVTPTTVNLATARFAPTVRTPIQLVPGTIPIATARFAPSVLAPVRVTPPATSLTTSRFAPTATVSSGQNPQLVTPAPAALTTSRFAPIVTAGASLTVTPAPRSLALTTYAPGVGRPTAVMPAPAALTITTYAPSVAAVSDAVVEPAPALLTLTTYPPRTGGLAATLPAGSGATVYARVPGIVVRVRRPSLTVEPEEPGSIIIDPGAAGSSVIVTDQPVATLATPELPRAEVRVS